MTKQRALTIAYNAICTGQLDEQFGENLLIELDCTKEEFKEIAEGDEDMIENVLGDEEEENDRQSDS